MEGIIRANGKLRLIGIDLIQEKNIFKTG